MAEGKSELPAERFRQLRPNFGIIFGEPDQVGFVLFAFGKAALRIAPSHHFAGDEIAKRSDLGFAAEHPGRDGGGGEALIARILGEQDAKFAARALGVEGSGLVLHGETGRQEFLANKRKFAGGDHQVCVHRVNRPGIGVHRESTDDAVVAVPFAHREHDLKVIESAATRGVECFLRGHNAM